MKPLNFRMSLAKTIEAAAMIVRFHGSRMESLRLLRLAYLADRKSLLLTSHPIFGGLLCTDETGPLHSRLNHLVSEVVVITPEWWEFFNRDGCFVELRSNPELAELSAHDMDVLYDVCLSSKNESLWDLCKSAAGFPEVTKHTDSSFGWEWVLFWQGVSEEEIVQIADDVNAHITDSSDTH